jgi:hypothetical protein
LTASGIAINWRRELLNLICTKSMQNSPKPTSDVNVILNLKKPETRHEWKQCPSDSVRPRCHLT